MQRMLGQFDKHHAALALGQHADQITLAHTRQAKEFLEAFDPFGFQYFDHWSSLSQHSTLEEISGLARHARSG